MIKLQRSCIQAVAMAILMGCMPSKASASPIEQIGDRYIIHVSELDLTGDESLYDLLMMCPDVLSFDGKGLIRNGQLATLYSKYAIRIDNHEYGLNYETFLHHLKAREIVEIQICQNAEVMKGAAGMKKIINITLRQGEEGDWGHVGLTGDTYGGWEGIATLIHSRKDLRIFSHVEGDQQFSKKDAGHFHNANEGAKVNLLWTPSEKDRLEVDIMQNYARSRQQGYTDDVNFRPIAAEYARDYHLETDYTRTLSESGAAAFFILTIDHSNYSQGGNYHDRSTYPWGVLEFNVPFLGKNLWLTAGLEGGIAVEEHLQGKYTDHTSYGDIYVQADYTVGKWGFIAGDRFRSIKFEQNAIAGEPTYRHTTHNHTYTLGVYRHFTPSNTLKATFSRRFYNPVVDDFIETVGSGEQTHMQYTGLFTHHNIYVSELRHSLNVNKDFSISSVVQNMHQSISTDGYDNTFVIGSTAFWHTGILRLTAGFNYFWDQTNFAVLKLAPQVSLPAGWRLTSTLIYNTRQKRETEVFAPANLYLECAAYKNLGKHWQLELRCHDLAGQHLANRAADIGCTYCF